MNKPISKSSPNLETMSRFYKSTFTLTFVIEVVGIDVWHDCNEGWIDLGPIAEGVRLQYQLYPGHTFDIDVIIWPHTAKVVCGSNHSWVRTWQFLQRRWVSFSIRHAFPARVHELRNFVATVVPFTGVGALSANSKGERHTEVYLPPLQFGERRQFATVIESDYPLVKYLKDIVWFRVMVHIPPSYLDGLFDTPYPVSDIRHQDAALYQVQNFTLNHAKANISEQEFHDEHKGKRLSKEKNKKTVEILKPKYEIKLSGDWILAGAGRVTPFESFGELPPDHGHIIALISSTNLPSVDDYPIFFVNVGNLTDIPMDNLKKNGFTHIYTRWTISEEEHVSEEQPLDTNEMKNEVNFNDHHSVPLPNALGSDIMSMFLDELFRVEIRGIRSPPQVAVSPKFFGYEKGDRDFGTGLPPPLSNQDADVLIAYTKIDARLLTKDNGFIKGDFPLYPPETSVVPLEREGICTNDINAIRAKVKPDIVIQPGVILESQMSLEVSLGMVGCKPHTVAQRFSRLYCLISDPEAIMMILRQISEINETVLITGNKGGLLTGFALDTGDTVMLYVEGPKEGHILSVWERTEDFHPDVKPVFSTSAKYRSRLYPELLQAAMPFNILKMFVPLSVLLGLTPIYARPAIPLPTRSAVLKIGRLVASKFASAPCRSEMPTAMELKSFRLELCVAPRPPPVTVSDVPLPKLSINIIFLPNKQKKNNFFTEPCFKTRATITDYKELLE